MQRKGFCFVNSSAEGKCNIKNNEKNKNNYCTNINNCNKNNNLWTYDASDNLFRYYSLKNKATSDDNLKCNQDKATSDDN